MTHCTRLVDPSPEDLMPEYITREDLGKIMERESETQPNAIPSTESIQENSEEAISYITPSQSKNDLTEYECSKIQNIKEEFTSEAAQSPRSSCSESELQIDISEHDVHTTVQEPDLNQLTSQSYKAKFQCEICPYETDIKSNFEVHVKVHRTVFACEWCHYITKSKIKLKNHQIKNHKNLVGHLMMHCSYCDYLTRSERTMKRHVKDMHKKSRKNKKKCDVETLPESVCRPESPYSEPRLQIDLGVEDAQSDSNSQIYITDYDMTVVNKTKLEKLYIYSQAQNEREQSTLVSNLDESKPLLSEPSTNHLQLDPLDIKVECTEELIQTCDETQLTSQSKKAEFQCDICPYESDFQEQFEVHLKVHKTVYACSFCKYRTFSEMRLARHYSLRCRNVSQKIKVEQSTPVHCAFSAEALTELKNQFSVTSNLTSPKFCCKLCRNKLDNQATVDEHMWKHTFVRLSRNSTKLKCPKCSFMDRLAHVMRRHFSLIHRDCPHYDTRDVEELPQVQPKSVKKQMLKDVKLEPNN